MTGTDVVVIGAGIVGAACAHHLSAAGLTVTVVDRGPVAGGTTGAGEGNILVSDKEPGPELDLALRSQQLWLALEDELGRAIELDRKGGVVVTTDADAQRELIRFAAAQSTTAWRAPSLDAAGARALEPHLGPQTAGAVHYPQDLQVQPMLAAAHLLVASGAQRRLGEEVVGLTTAHGRVTGVRTNTATLPCRYVVNAAGTWGANVAELLGAPIPVRPRRGFVLVTEPLPPTVHHKVYSAEYVANVASDDAALQTSSVIEGTESGTVLIGASRERVGFDRRLNLDAVQILAAAAARIFPVLADVKVLRVYRGFRPYAPDHLPIIGADPRVDGVLHACGHEGAGVGLAPATGELITAAITGTSPPVDPAPFRPDRFEVAA